MQWFRFYSEFARDPKIRVLEAEIQLSFVLLLCMKCEGLLPSSDEKISFFLQISLKKWKNFKKILIENNLISPECDIINWEKRQYKSDTSAERTRLYRERLKQHCDVTVTPSETETETDIKKTTSSCPQQADDDQSQQEFLSEKTEAKIIKALIVPYQEIVNLYHQICYELPTVKVLSETRKRQIKARWLEKTLTMKKHNEETGQLEIYYFNDLRAWQRLFEKIAKSDFLCGRVQQRDRKPFLADLEWITKQANFIKIIENKYVQ